MTDDRRKRRASLPFTEKLKILEKLRQRSRVIAAAGLRRSRPEKQVRSSSDKP